MPNPLTDRSPSTPGGATDPARAARKASLERHPTLLGVAPAAPIVIGSPSSPSSPQLGTPSAPEISGTPIEPILPALAPVERIDTPPKHTFEAIALEEDALPRRRPWAVPAAILLAVAAVVALVGWRFIHRAPAAEPAPVAAIAPAPPAATAPPAAPPPVVAAPVATDAAPKSADPAPAAAAKPATHAATPKAKGTHKAKPHKSKAKTKAHPH